MKIAKIRAIALHSTRRAGRQVKGHAAEECDRHTLVEVEADDGTVGVGTCSTSIAFVRAVLDSARRLLVGESALEPGRVSERVEAVEYTLGRGGAIAHVRSGIDIALWDLFGKCTNQPVARLLGGYYRDRVRAYASIPFAAPPVLKEHVLTIISQGFRSIKLGPSDFGRISRKYDELLVKTVRETVGPYVELMVRAGGSEEDWPHGYKWAAETARMLHEYDVTWFEEPLPPDHPEDLERLRERAAIMIAVGESITSLHAFRRLITERVVDVIHLDATKCGGISRARRIAWTAHDEGVLVAAHSATAVGLAADLQLAASRPVARWIGYQPSSPYMTEIAMPFFELDEEGFLAIPTSPGLGIELDADRIAQLSGSARVNDAALGTPREGSS